MITHELLKRPLTKDEAVSLAAHLKDKVDNTVVTEPGYFYLDQDDTVYFAVARTDYTDYADDPVLWKLQDGALHGSQEYWERQYGTKFRALRTGGTDKHPKAPL